MKILITGATGFIGRFVSQLLAHSGHQIHVISRAKTIDEENKYQLDICDHEKTRQLMARIKADVLIHLAWDVTHGEYWNANININYAEASINLFGSFIENGGKKIIAAGSGAEYPESLESLLECKNYPGELSLYGQSKRRVFDYLTNCSKGLIDYTWFRIFGIYGPGENPKRFFPMCAHSIQKKIDFNINQPGCFFDYVYVEDVAYFIAKCINLNGLGAINIGTGNSRSLSDLFNMIKHYLETGLFKDFHDDKMPHSDSRIPDCTLLHQNGFKFELQSGFKILNLNNADL